jgi:hypothetical protein
MSSESVVLWLLLFVLMSRSISVRAIDTSLLHKIGAEEENNEGRHIHTPLAIEPDIRHSSFSKVSKFFQHASATLGIVELMEVSSGVDAVAKVCRQHDLYKTWKSAIIVEDPDAFRADVLQHFNATNSVASSGQGDDGSYCPPLSGLRASDVIANVEIGSHVKVVDIYKLTKDLKVEFKQFTFEPHGDKVEKYYTGAEVSYN